jgi:hypothetical protein
METIEGRLIGHPRMLKKVLYVDLARQGSGLRTELLVWASNTPTYEAMVDAAGEVYGHGNGPTVELRGFWKDKGKFKKDGDAKGKWGREPRPFTDHWFVVCQVVNISI